MSHKPPKTKRLYLADLPLEIIFTILDHVAGNRAYRCIEQCLTLESILGLTNGELTGRYPLVKLLFDKSNSMNEWKSLVDFLDELTLVTGSTLRWFLAGKFVSSQLGRIEERSLSTTFIKIYLCYPRQSSGSRKLQRKIAGWTLERGGHHSYIYKRDNNCIFKFFLVLDKERGNPTRVDNAAATVLYSFNLKINQCALMPNGQFLTVDTCMNESFEPASEIMNIRRNLYMLGYQVVDHEPECKRLRCNHWPYVY